MARKPVITIEVEQDFKDKVISVAGRKGLKMAPFVKLVLYEAIGKELAA